jgi:quercetin dioxygenase-like cupin family protein
MRMLVSLALLSGCSGASSHVVASSSTGAPALQPQTGEVEKKGQVSKGKLETVVAGHLTELNGKYKLRASEVTYEPGGFIGSHHHAGPGIRCVTSGELTYIQPSKTTIYRAGDCFFESGDVSHTAENRTSSPVVLINFEILPVAWTGASAVPVPN